jgi:hypothetical protein
LGFDSHGSDGSFGPRSREAISAWQKSRGQSSTGYLTAAQTEALLREAQPALQRIDQEKRRAAAAPTQGVADGTYVGSLSASALGGGQAALRPVQAELRLAGQQLTGRLMHSDCGVVPVSFTVDPSGAISGRMRIPEANGCPLNQASASGRVGGGSLTLEIRSVDLALRGTLSAPNARPAASPAPTGQRVDVP